MTATPYDSIADQFGAARTRLQPKEVEYLRLVLGPLAPGSRVLDLGCGTGHPIATHIIELGHHVVGVDGSAPMLAAARRRHPTHRWVHALMEQVMLDETFDAAVCWDSLFHLPRRHFQPVIGKLHNWLKPGARLMVSSGGAADTKASGFTDTMFGQEFFYDSLPPLAMVSVIEEAGFDVLLAEMCDQPDGARNKGKWATVASRR